MADVATLCIRVREIQGVLAQQMRSAEWTGLSGTLSSLSQTAEYAGQKNLCLQAQALSELLGNRGGGRAQEPGSRVLELMEQLLSGLSHWSWSLEEAVQAARIQRTPVISSENKSSSLLH